MSFLIYSLAGIGAEGSGEGKGFVQTINSVAGRRSLDELGRFASGPRVVGDAKADAIANGRVIEKKENLNGIGVGVN
jgi:hypothetical protein